MWFDGSGMSLFAADGPEIASMLFPLVMIAALFYLLIARPEKRKRNEIAEMQQGLKKNARVVTVGGIIGVVTNVQQDSAEVTLRIDENNNTRIRILRTSISRVLTDENVGDKKDAV